MAGILLWNVVGVGLSQGTQSLVANAGLLRKVKVSYWLFPLVPLGTALTNVFLSLIPFTLVMLFSGKSLHWEMLLAIPTVACLALFLFGVTLGLSSLNVFFRDVGHVLEPVLTILFYGTPIRYPRQSRGFENA